MIDSDPPGAHARLGNQVIEPPPKWGNLIHRQRRLAGPGRPDTQPHPRPGDPGRVRPRRRDHRNDPPDPDRHPRPAGALRTPLAPATARTLALATVLRLGHPPHPGHPATHLTSRPSHPPTTPGPRRSRQTGRHPTPTTTSPHPETQTIPRNRLTNQQRWIQAERCSSNCADMDLNNPHPCRSGALLS